MTKKEFFLQDYLELIDFDDFEIQNETTDDAIKFKTNYYPFNKQQLINYLETENFLTTIDVPEKKIISNKNESISKSFDILKLKEILNTLPDDKKQKNLEFEKRRRYQTYKALDYYLSHFTYFDFFSYDLFQIAKTSKFLGQIYKKEKISLSLLFLACLDSTFTSGKILKKFGFNEKFVEKLSLQIKQNSFFTKNDSLLPFFMDWKKKKFSTEFLMKFENFFNFFAMKNTFLDQTIDYDFEVNQIYEKSSENALERFKTPIITDEILLITILEHKNSTISKLLKKMLPDQTKWYIFRYKLLKRLYNQEINLRTLIPRNQHFFAYLLKTELSAASFELLIKKKLLSKAVWLFRNILISDLLSKDLTNNFEEETFVSIFESPERKYS